MLKNHRFANFIHSLNSFNDDRKTQVWKFKADTKQLYLEGESKCLIVTESSTLALEKCDEFAENQKWELENLRPKKL